MKNPREVALKGLINLRRSGTWPDLFLKQETKDLSPQDGGLCAEILYGTLENINLLDFYLAHFSTVKLKKLMPQVLDILRLTTYQIVFLDRIPPSAAVNEGVKLVKKYARPAEKYANGVLRTISKNKEVLPPVPKDDFAEYLSISYSHPKWFAKEMLQKLGEQEAEALLKANNGRAAVTARVNTLKTTVTELLFALEEEGIQAEKCQEVANVIVFDKGGNPADTRLFKDGHYYIQDIAAQLAVLALDIKRGETVIDLCAAPGGKSLIAAQELHNEGKVYAFDVHAHKIELIADNAKKYGAAVIEAKLSDSTVFCEEYANRADKVICDVPCSGMGVIRKKPDIRFKKQEELADLPQIQYKILCNGGNYLKTGGTLVYSTCTVRHQENEAVVERFLKEHTNFALVPLKLQDKTIPEGFTTLYPHRDGCDGFFIAMIRKIKE